MPFKLTRLIQNIKVERLVSVSILFSSALLANVILLSGVWLLGQLVTPSEFGLYAVASGFAIAAHPVFTLRMEQAIPVANREATAEKIYLLCLLLIGTFFLIALACVLLLNALPFNETLPHAFHSLALATTFLAVALSAEKLNQTLALRRAAMGTLAALRVVRAIILVGAQLGLSFLLGWHASALLLGQALATIIVTWILASRLDIQSWLGDSKAWRALPRRALPIMRHFRHFPLVNMPHAFIHGALSAFYGVLLATLYGSVAVGQFYMMMRMVFAALDLVGGALLQQGIAEAASKEPGRLKDVFKFIIIAMLAVSVPIAFVSFVFGESLFSFIVGEKWAAAGMIAAASVGRIIMEPITSTLSFVPNFLNRQREAFAWSMVQNFVGLGSLFLAHAFGADLFWAIAISATAMSIVMLTFVIWLWTIVQPAPPRSSPGMDARPEAGSFP